MSIGCCAGIAGTVGTAGINPNMSNSTRMITVCQIFVLAAGGQDVAGTI